MVELQPRMPAIRVPLLILHGGADRVTDPAGSRLLAERAGSTEKKLVLVGPALHSLLHEPEGPAVQAEILAFVGARVGPAPRP
jgi:alpha-beta hydrolase superfamily lysophospholipase